ncbi:hypothetical protein [Streptosporangium sp. KLBMP 9127]|nr:hypothetical protein [Streptosporangium sp. KLBMP 9127]
MDPDTFRGDLGGVATDIYWRRRMALLVGVLVVVAVVAWACTSTSGPKRSSNSAAPAPTSPEPILASLQATPTPAPAPTLTSTISPKPSKPKPTIEPRRAGDTCDPGDLVLSLQGTQEVYLGDSRPRFMITLVNTGRLMCTADVGPRAMEIRITSGSDRIWSSSDCISGEGVQVRRLERGIPYVRPVEWDRHRSARDCAAKRSDARTGTYVAAVHSTDLKTPKTVFHLR